MSDRFVTFALRDGNGEPNGVIHILPEEVVALTDLPDRQINGVQIQEASVNIFLHSGQFFRVASTAQKVRRALSAGGQLHEIADNLAEARAKMS